MKIENVIILGLLGVILFQAVSEMRSKTIYEFKKLWFAIGCIALMTAYGICVILLKGQI